MTSQSSRTMSGCRCAARDAMPKRRAPLHVLNAALLRQLVARCCDAKIPESCRFGEPFEYTWQAWLQTQFVPVFRRVLKGKA